MKRADVAASLAHEPDRTAAGGLRADVAELGVGEAGALDPGSLQGQHLFMLNREILLTPFHTMALMSPATTAAQVDAHTELFAAATSALMD